MDLEKKKLIYKDSGDRIRMPVMKEDVLLYSVKDSILKMVNVKTGVVREIPLDVHISPNWTLASFKNQVLVFRKKGLDVYDLKGKKLKEYEYPRDFVRSNPILIVENEVFYNRRNLEGYNVLNFENGETFSFGDNRLHLPHSNLYIERGTGIKKFPIPVMIYKGTSWEFALINSKGEIVFSKDLGLDENLGGLFWVEDDNGDRFIMNINQGKKIVADRKERFFLEIPYRDIIDMRFSSDGGILITTSGCATEKSKLIYYDKNGNKVLERVTEPFVNDPLILAENQNEILLGNMDFMKYSFPGGEITGLYIFPIKYVAEYAGFYKGEVFITESNRYRGDDNVHELNLLSFPISSRGWFDLSLNLKPNTGKPFEVHNDLDVEVEVRAEENFLEKGISFSVDKGSFSMEERGYNYYTYSWHTPLDEGKVKITVSLGPLSRDFVVDIKKLENPLVIESVEKKWCLSKSDPFVFYIEGYVRNESNIPFRDLEWEVTGENAEILESYFPDDIDGYGKRNFRIKVRMDTSKMKVSWKGYGIDAKVNISLSYNRGSLKKVVEESFSVQPKYGFTVNFYNEKPYKPLKPDPEKFSIYDENGVKIKGISKTVHGNTIKVEGLARGFPSHPLVLTLKYMKFQKKIEMIKPNPSYTMKLNFTSSMRVLVKGYGKTKKGVSISLVKLDEPDKSWKRTTKGDGICVFDGLEKGDYKVVFSKTEYISVEKMVNLDIGDLKEIELDIEPYRVFLVYIESYYKSALSDKLDVKFEGARNLIKVENTDSVYIIPENTDKIYFNMLYKLGYPEGVVSSIFSEKSYDAVVEVLKGEYEFVAYLSKYQGKKIVTFKESDIYKPGENFEERLGDPFNVSEIKKPRKLVIEATASAGDNEKTKKITIWLFPSNWIGYERETKQVVILYPLKDNMDALDYGNDAKDYLSNVQGELISLALNKIVWYGAESLEIFEDKAGWKDSPFRSFLASKSKNFVKEKLLKVVGKLAGELAKGVVSEYLDIFDMIKNASDWGGRVPEVENLGVSLVYASSLLKNTASQDSNFNTIIKMEKILKKKLSLLITKVEENDPEGVRQIMNDIRILTVGPNPQNKNIEDHRIDYSRYGDLGNRLGYTLAVLCGLEYNNIKRWEDDSDYPDYFGDDALSYTVKDKINASHEAVKIYKPLFKNLIMLTVPIVYASLIE